MRLRLELAGAAAHQWPRVACTGHRPQHLPDGCGQWLTAELERIAAKLATEHGMGVVISGAAAGADLYWADAVRHHAHLWLYQPFDGHDSRWDQAWRDRLATARAAASRVDTLAAGFSRAALSGRNEWMLRDRDALVAVLDPQRSRGGTLATLRSAQHRSMPVVRVDVRHRRTTLQRPVE